MYLSHCQMNSRDEFALSTIANSVRETIRQQRSQLMCKLPGKILDLCFNYLEAQEAGRNNQQKNALFSYYVDQMPITIHV